MNFPKCTYFSGFKAIHTLKGYLNISFLILALIQSNVYAEWILADATLNLFTFLLSPALHFNSPTHLRLRSRHSAMKKVTKNIHDDDDGKDCFFLLMEIENEMCMCLNN